MAAVPPPAKIRKQPQQARAKHTVNRLLEATAAVLRRDGFDGASTNRIAAEAGVSIGSLYQYFPNKESLVAALAERLGEQEQAVMEDKLGQLDGEPLGVAVRELVAALVELHRIDPGLHRVLVEQVPRIGETGFIRDNDRRTAAMLRAFLSGYRDEVAADEAARKVFVIMHAVESVTHQAVLHAPEMLGDSALVDDLTRMVLGLLTDPTDATAAA